MYMNSFDLVSDKVVACFHQYAAFSPKTCTSLFSCIWTPNFKKACTFVHALAIHHLNPFDLVSDKVVACNQCTDVCFVSAVVEMGNYLLELPTWRKQLYLFDAPAIHQLNPFDLVSDKIVACFLCTDVCSMSAVVFLENYCVEAIHCVIVSHDGDNAIDQLKPIRPCVRREI